MPRHQVAFTAASQVDGLAKSAHSRSMRNFRRQPAEPSSPRTPMLAFVQQRLEAPPDTAGVSTIAAAAVGFR